MKLVNPMVTENVVVADRTVVQSVVAYSTEKVVGIKHNFKELELVRSSTVIETNIIRTQQYDAKLKTAQERINTLAIKLGYKVVTEEPVA